MTALRLDPRSRYKREWERAQPRAECACGATLGIDSARQGHKQCQECYQAPRRAARQARRELIWSMWMDGEDRRDIAAAIGYTLGALGVETNRMRNDGWDLPHRHRWDRR